MTVSRGDGAKLDRRLRSEVGEKRSFNTISLISTSDTPIPMNKKMHRS